MRGPASFDAAIITEPIRLPTAMTWARIANVPAPLDSCLSAMTGSSTARFQPNRVNEHSRAIGMVTAGVRSR